MPRRGSAEGMKGFLRALGALAGKLTEAGIPCRAVLPDVDGGLLLLVAGVEGGPLKVELVPREQEPPAIRLGRDAGERSGKILEVIDTFLASMPHPLFGFRGREMDSVCVDRDRKIQPLWRDYLVAGEFFSDAMRLESVRLEPGAMYLEFVQSSSRTGRDGVKAKVVFRVCDFEDPRLKHEKKLLRVGRMALSPVVDTRPAPCPPELQPERALAFLLAHTTNPRTRLTAARRKVPEPGVFDSLQSVNPFVGQSRQGAAGVLAALAGYPRRRLKVLALGDAACRQTFPPLDRLLWYGEWSYFPVSTAIRPGDWVAIDFGEEELIGGVENRLADVLRGLKKEQEGLRVAIIQTCISRLIGDDVRGVCNEILGPGRWVLLNPDFQSRLGAVDSVLWPWLLESFAKGTSRRDGRRRPLVNLVGYGHPGMECADELERLLGSLGIGVNSWLFPSFREEELESFDRADITVVSDSDVVVNAFSGVLAREPAGWVRLAPPFGVEATVRWLEKLAELVLPGSKLEKARRTIAEASADAERRLAPLRARLAATRLGIVTSASLCAFVFRPAESFGVPLVSLAGELGIGLHCMVFEDRPIPPELLRLAESNRLELEVFDSPDRLLERLERSPPDYVLNGVTCNLELAKRSTFPLPINRFKMGFEGIVGTACELVRIADSRLGARMARWLR